MAHHKRRKPRSKVRCTICTDSRIGNANPAKAYGAGSVRRQRARRFDWLSEYLDEETEAQQEEQHG